MADAGRQPKRTYGTGQVPYNLSGEDGNPMVLWNLFLDRMMVLRGGTDEASRSLLHDEFYDEFMGKPYPNSLEVFAKYWGHIYTLYSDEDDYKKARDECVEDDADDDDDDDDDGWEQVYNASPDEPTPPKFSAKFSRGNTELAYLSEGLFYQTYGGGPEGGFVVLEGRVYHVHRDWGIPWRVEELKDHTFHTEVRDGVLKCAVRKSHS